MSTKLNDIANQVILGVGLAPQTVTSSTNGAAADMISGDGPCFAIQQIGTVSGSSPMLAGKIQESDDGLTGWSDINEATFTTVTASTNYQAVTFQRTKRYLRYVATVDGSSPSFATAVIVSQQKKQV